MQNIETLAARVQGKKHLPELQSLRGIAAIVVLLSHSTAYFARPQWLRHVSEVILNAHAAVVLFFVLSGFVLQLSLSKVTLKSISSFYIRRAWRIYPALFAASALALAYCLLFHGTPMPNSVSGWWESEWRLGPLRPLHVAAVFLGFGGSFLPIPVWTLTVEIAGSILMPLVATVTRWGRWASLALILLLGAISVFWGRHFPTSVRIYEVDFALGASICQFPEIFKRITQTDKRSRFCAILALLGLTFIRQIGPWGFYVDYHNPIASGLEALFATFLVGIIACRSDAFPILSRSTPVWIGDVSYSLYLLHLPLLGFIAALGGEVLSIPALRNGGVCGTLLLMGLTLLCALPISAFSYRIIEVPGLRIGKRLAGRINRTEQAAVSA